MSNKYVKQLLSEVSERFSIDSVTMTMCEWICKNTTLRNRPFSFKGYEFQKKIVDDMHENMSVIKISQVGITEIQIRKILGFLVRNNGTSAIFTLPTEDMFKRVSNSRIKPLIGKDKVFNTEIDRELKVVRSMDMMQFNQSFLYVVPAIETAATSIPADAVFIDEVDLSDQQMVSLFNSRMQNSNYKISQRFSTPTFPNYGADLDWKVSDQHMYLCKCDSCGHWNHPEFAPEFIHLPGLPEGKLLTDVTIEFAEQLEFENSYVMCEKCRSPLDLSEAGNREWVAKYASRTHQRGYRIGPFSTGRLDIKYIYSQLWDYQKNEYLRGFYNTVLGLPYSDGSMQIPEEDILACIVDGAGVPNVSTDDDLWVGVDMGAMCHITICKGPNKENLNIVKMYQIHSHNIADHLEDLVKTHKIRGGCVDRHPFEPTAREIFLRTNGVILPVEYRGQKDTNIVFDEYGEMSHAQVNPTWFLDNFAEKIKKRKMRIMGYGYNKRVIVEHFRDMVREDNKKKPGDPAKWSKLTGNDHYLHSSAFAVLAPHLIELIKLKSKEDQRTMILSAKPIMKDNTSNLIGTSQKRLAINPLDR